ncbi:MAG TPA: hypothetical protein VGL38_03620 [bacterium]|jgi:hypothetical protein
MQANWLRFVIAGLALLLIGLLMGCSSDEDKLTNPGPRAEVIGLTYDNPVAIKISPSRHWALLLHDSTSSRGPAVQLVDLQRRSVLATRILDYHDAYDIEFLPNDEACVAGAMMGGTGYAVQFLSLPNLVLEARVITATAGGAHGYLAVDSAGGSVYYSHSGGGSSDGVYKISLTTKTLVDADNDGQAPFVFDNGLVSGIFDQPSRMVFDGSTRKLMVANLGDDYISVIDSSVWGHLNRQTPHSFPGLAGTARLSTVGGGVASLRAESMIGAQGKNVFAARNNGAGYLARFGSDYDSVNVGTVTGMPWNYRAFRGVDIQVDPAEPVFSVFLLEKDGADVGIGQYSLNSLRPVVSPFRTRTIPDTSISAFGLDVTSNQLVVGDAHSPRLELITIR